MIAAMDADAAPNAAQPKARRRWHPLILGRRNGQSAVSIFDLDPSLEPLIGSLAWNVSYGVTNLSMELGEPSIRVIHEPIPSVTIAGKRGKTSAREIRRNLNRRRVSVCGRWRLWLYFSHWRIVRSGVSLASGSSSMRRIGPVLRDLKGQRLLARIDPQTGATRFEFDLDTVLEARRTGRRSKDELWLLSGLDGYERAVRGNGKFSRKRCRR